MTRENIYVTIMAGGVGSRFWPLSRRNKPKQFLDIFGTGETLIQQTVERFKNICPIENIMVVTNRGYADLVAEQLPSLPKQNILGEPIGRNTAPCLAYAAFKIRERNPNALMIAAPADHVVLKEDRFAETIDIALEQAESSKALVTLGIKPNRPDTGYGYIQFKSDKAGVHEHVKKVKTFTEKPDEVLALEFLKSGDFYWNSGIFIWSISSIMNEFGKHLPDLHQLFEEGRGQLNSDKEDQFIDKIYPQCQNISIDYGIMEKANKVYVVLSDFGWSDLGTYQSLYEHLDKDEDDNYLEGAKLRAYDSSGNLVKSQTDRMVVLQGAKDLIVVDTDEVLMICNRNQEQKIKKVVSDLRASKDSGFA